LDVVNALLKANVNVNAIDSSGNTSCHYACKNGNMDIAIQLLKHGASLNVTNALNKSVIDMALYNHHHRMWHYLKDEGHNIYPNHIKDMNWNRRKHFLLFLKSYLADHSTLDESKLVIPKVFRDEFICRVIAKYL
jgi:ankyrin repeat protein